MGKSTLALVATSFEDEFKQWVGEGYGSAALYIIVVLVVVAVVLKATG